MVWVIKDRFNMYRTAAGWSHYQGVAAKYVTKEEARANLKGRDVRIVRLKPPRSQLSRDVAEFHAMIGEVSPKVPTVPDRDAVRMRLALVLEETIELLEASGMSRTWHCETRFLLRKLKEGIVAIDPDMVKMADALADIAYVTEGTFQRIGVNSGPIMAEVHRSNMAKRGAGKDANGKWQKPKGWTPPDIAGELRKQGWRGGAK